MRALVRSVWDEPRPPGAPARVRRDWVLVAVLGVAVVIEGLSRPDLPWRGLSVALGLGWLPALLFRRTRPLLTTGAVFATCGAAALLTDGQVPQLDAVAYVLVLLYSLPRWGSGRETLLGAAVVLSGVVAALLAGDNRPGDVVGAFAVVLAASATGVAVRYRNRARTRELDQAKLLERERLARDLHDTVAHHVSAIAIRAQAGLATAAGHPDAAADALRVIEAEASRTLAEMRGIVRALRRGEPADLAPGPSLTDLHLLTGSGRAGPETSGGPAVEVRVTGDVAGVPPSVGAAVYRLAQEAVTNARRHARHATRIHVRVSCDDASVRLEVTDDGDARPSSVAANPGFGLVGMVERATLLGGTCQAGPGPGRGWTVTAVLPRTGWAT